MTTSETKEELTKRVALQLQIALTAWNELYPDDTDEDACRKSLDLVEFEVEDLLTRPDPPPQAPPVVPPMQAPAPGGTSDGPFDSSVDDDEAEVQALTSRAGKRKGGASFRQMLIDIGHEYPGGFDISTVIEDARKQGWTHPNARSFVSVTCSQLVRAGLLVRRERGTYALSPAFLGGEVDPEP